MTETTDQVAALTARYAALRRAAGSKSADPGGVLEAAFTELEGAIDLLRGSGTATEAGAGTGPWPAIPAIPARPRTPPNAACSAPCSRTRRRRCSSSPGTASSSGSTGPRAT